MEMFFLVAFPIRDWHLSGKSKVARVVRRNLAKPTFSEKMPTGGCYHVSTTSLEIRQWPMSGTG